MALLEGSGEIDLDAVATVRPEPEVLEAMQPWLSIAHAHPDSPHARGARARAEIEQARADVGALLAMPPEAVLFTSGATESNNLAIRGQVLRELARGCAGIAVPAHEHASLLHPCRALARSGARIEILAVGRDGLVAPDAIPHAPFSLLAFSHAHPELGALQPSSSLARRARSASAVCLVDVSWTVGRIATDGARLGDPEMISLSFHRMGGPMGVGALVLREGIDLSALLHGGSAERGIRPGTPNLAGIVGAGAASRRALRSLSARCTRLARLGRRMSEQVLAIHGVRASGPGIEGRLPGHVSVLVDGVDGDALVTALDALGVLISTGSPCADAAGLPSSALLAAGYAREEARSAVVLCIPPIGDADETEIDHAVALFAREVARLRRVAGCVAHPEA